MDSKFKPDTPPRKHLEIQTPEYSFEEGVTACTERIQELMRSLGRDVFVVINGSGTDVGKTALVAALQIELQKLGIESEHTPSENIVHESKKVVFSTQLGLFWKEGGNYRDDLMRVNPELPVGSYGDLYIGIYRPDKKFSSSKQGITPVADIMICNKHAKDDTSKSRQ